MVTAAKLSDNGKGRHGQALIFDLGNDGRPFLFEIASLRVVGAVHKCDIAREPTISHHGSHKFVDSRRSTIHKLQHAKEGESPQEEAHACFK